MQEFLANLKKALKQNPNLIPEIPVKKEIMSEQELALLFEEDKSENNERSGEVG